MIPIHLKYSIDRLLRMNGYRGIIDPISGMGSVPFNLGTPKRWQLCEVPQKSRRLGNFRESRDWEEIGYLTWPGTITQFSLFSVYPNGGDCELLASYGSVARSTRWTRTNPGHPNRSPTRGEIWP